MLTVLWLNLVQIIQAALSRAIGRQDWACVDAFRNRFRE